MKNVLDEILNVSIELTSEKNRNVLLDKLLVCVMNLSCCDAGTLYLVNGNELEFKIMKTLSMNIDLGKDGEVIDLPGVPLTEENVCAYSAIHKEIINLEDVYTCDTFNFSGPKKYDEITGYRTQSMLVFPIENYEGNVVGVIQLMNAQKDGQIVPFSKENETIFKALSSITAISLLNMMYVDELKEQMSSFVDAFTTAIDQRTPYNASHTRMVSKYTELLVDIMNKKYKEGMYSEYFDDARKEQVILSASLHDIGKMITPLVVMNKATRLDQSLKEVVDRFELIKAINELDFYKGKQTEEMYELNREFIESSIQFIQEVNESGFLADSKIERILEISTHTYEWNGEVHSYLSDVEVDCLTVRKGTLTNDERQTMEDHVLMTRKILENVHFSNNNQKVVRFASSHHEMMNGSGYPNHLKGDELDTEIRILAIADIFDALVASDRPYKKGLPKHVALEILQSMVDEGKLDGVLVEYFIEAMEK